MRSRRRDQRALLGLVDLAYAASEDARRWDVFLLSLADVLDGRGAGLLHHDLVTNGTVVAAVRFNPTTPQLDDDPTRPRDGTRHLSVNVDLRGSTHSLLSILRGDSDAPFEADDIRLFRAVARHVRRALQVHQHLVAARRVRSVATEALDAIGSAVFLVDAELQVVLTNEKGRALLAARDGLSTQKGRLCAARPGETQHLRSICTEVRKARHRRSSGAAFCIERPSGRSALQVLVVPPAPTESMGFVDSAITAFVFVTDPADQRRPSELLLRQLYGLTPAESDVAACLALGWTLGAIAARRGTAIETVRRQNKLILAKTGARHRGELVRRLSMMLPLGHNTPTREARGAPRF